MFLFESPPLISGFQFLMALLGFIVLVGGAIVVLLATRKNTVSSVQILRAEASEALVKTRDTEIVDCKKKLETVSEELEDVTVELRGQMGINVGQLMTYWEKRTQELARMENLEQQNRVLVARLGDNKDPRS
jgi:hypothetical protein